MKKRKRAKQRAEHRSERELERLVSQTGLKGSAREQAAQYGRGMLEGMHIAYLAVAMRLLRAGNSRGEIESFFSDLLDSRELARLMEEAEEPSSAKIA